MKLVKFTVEMRHPETGFWETAMPFKPAYSYVTSTSRFLGIPYRKVQQITNEDDAIINARKRAIYHAQVFWSRGRLPGVRIMKWTEDCKGFESVSIVWEDGKFLDC